MSFTIALAGKGGTGKTTIAALLVRYMVRKGLKPVLGVDADSNSNLNEVLCVPLYETLSDARDMMKKEVPPGMTKDIFMEMKGEQALVEGDGFDLIAMGKPEGAGCYCAANNLLSNFMERMIKRYEYMIVDNAAGMEHFSRLTLKDIDLLIVVSDASQRGFMTACRILTLVKNLPIQVHNSVLVVNRVQRQLDSWPPEVMEHFDEDKIWAIRDDPLLAQFDFEGKPTIELPDDAPVVKATESIFGYLFSKELVERQRK